MDKFKRFRFFFYLPIIIIGLLCTIVFDWALYVQEEKTLQNWMQQIADAEILRLNRAMDRYINKYFSGHRGPFDGEQGTSPGGLHA